MALRSAGGASIGWNCPFLSDMPVRPFAENDIPQVADLYWTVLRQRHGLAEAARHGVDRVVRLGQMHVFSSPWDGMDLVRPMVRLIRHTRSQDRPSVSG